MNESQKVEKVLERVTFELQVPIEQLRGASRKHRPTSARRIVAYVLKKVLGYAERKIGEILNRGQSTINGMLNTVESDEQLREDAEWFCEKCKCDIEEHEANA